MALLFPLAAIITTNVFIVAADRVMDEDLYVAASDGIVEGVIQGDLVTAVGQLVVSGRVEGDLVVTASDRVVITGEVLGSVRGAVPRLEIEGSVGDDVFVAAADVRVSGAVGRDLAVLGGRVRVDGTVGRDVLGRIATVRIDGGVGRDLDIAVQDLTIGAGAQVEGDVVYRSTRAATIDAGARLDGVTVRTPAQGNFVIELIRALAEILSFVAFVASGLVVLIVLRHIGPLAAAQVVRRPWVALGWGLGATVALPGVAVVLGVTLVGIPLALLALGLWMVLLVFGPVPAVTAAGAKITRGRGGIYGAFVVGAVLWRMAIAIVPIVGPLLYPVALVWGSGAWLVAGWRVRQRLATNGPVASVGAGPDASGGVPVG